MKQRQIHCFSDCISHALESDGRLDYRPVYIGVWDYPFRADAEGIAYYDHEIRPDGLFRDIEEMYGVYFHKWLDHTLTNEVNFSALEHQVSLNERQAITCLVDLYEMPYSQYYQKQHFPHMVLVRGRTEEGWELADPYLGWNGHIDAAAMRKAFGFEDLISGFSIPLDFIRQPDKGSIARVFERYMEARKPTLAEQVKAYVLSLAGESDFSWKKLQLRIHGVGIVSKRLLAYGQVLSLFTEERSEYLDSELEHVNELVKRWEQFLLSLLRLSLLGKGEDLYSIINRLDVIAEQETSVRRTLTDCFNRWRSG